MGFIRGVLITFFSIVLFFSLFLMNFTLVLSLSLNYDNLQPALKSSADGILTNSLAQKNMFSEDEKKNMEDYCSVEEDYIFTYENYSFVIPCEIIEQGENSIADYITVNLIDSIYYAKYNCEFLECVKDSPSLPFVLFSEKAKDYWNGKFFLLAALSLLLFALIFLISKDRPGRFIVGGVLVILSALPFRKLDWISTFIPNNNLSVIFSAFFTKAHLVFIVMLIIGTIFIIWGILCKIFGWKMKFKKDEEQSKVNLQKKKKKY
jgi:hypothetical protein